MNRYRISKYNPKYRNKNGNYEINEWTAFSDIGKKFTNEILTNAEYERIEENYLEFFMELLKSSKDHKVIIKGQEPEKIFKKTDFLIDDDWLKIIFKQNMRENFWTKFITKNFVIYFGQDLYLHIETKNDVEALLNKLSLKYALFIETLS